MNIGSLFRLLSYPFTTPYAGFVEEMGNLSLTECVQPRLLPAYQLPSPSLRLALDEGHPLPVLHPSLPLPTTPPPSPTPRLTPPPIHSASKEECAKWCKDQMDLYGPKKRGQRCRPSSPITQAKREIGLQEA